MRGRGNKISIKISHYTEHYIEKRSIKSKVLGLKMKINLQNMHLKKNQVVPKKNKDLELSYEDEGINALIKLKAKPSEMIEYSKHKFEYLNRKNEIQNRSFVLKSGNGLAFFFGLGSVVTLIFGVPIIGPLALLTASLSCAGAAFAIESGETIKLSDFSHLSQMFKPFNERKKINHNIEQDSKNNVGSDSYE